MPNELQPNNVLPPGFIRLPHPRNPGSTDPDPTLEFADERASAPETGLKIHIGRRAASAALLVLLAVAAAAGAFWADHAQSAAAIAGGAIRIESDPIGADVHIGGTSRGKTPLTLMLPVGRHAITVHHGESTKELRVAIAEGVETVHYVTWTAPVIEAPVIQTGSLHVATDVPGGVVIVDGTERGRAPLTLTDLAVGPHEVIVRGNGLTHRRSVRVETGTTASLVISRVTTGTPTGWMSVNTPVSMQIFEQGRLAGTTEVDRIMLPAGEHEFEFVSEALGFRTTRTVKITGGQTEAVALQLPRAPISINAVPWAEVAIDGNRVGETPLANVMLPLGPHELVFRHPQLGERRITTVVTQKDTARVSVDMRTP